MKLPSGVYLVGFLAGLLKENNTGINKVQVKLKNISEAVEKYVTSLIMITEAYKPNIEVAV